MILTLNLLSMNCHTMSPRGPSQNVFLQSQQLFLFIPSITCSQVVMQNTIKVYGKDSFPVSLLNSLIGV